MGHQCVSLDLELEVCYLALTLDLLFNSQISGRNHLLPANSTRKTVEKG